MSYDAIVLFSGGLDSILAAKNLESQGLSVLCLHCFSPFFGDPGAALKWQKIYSLEIECLDVASDFVKMLCDGPAHGVGKNLNPCIDCKILLLKKAGEYMQAKGAKFVATGEVLGQRPMSQRRDTLFLIAREAGMREWLLRPLSARYLPPTPMEENGIVSREKLLGISGRGRNAQLELAKEYNLPEIPSAAGGCLLTEKENAIRYWQLLKKFVLEEQNDSLKPHINKMCRYFKLANIGRQLWQGKYWLGVGRNKADNEILLKHAENGDTLLKLCDYPGPVALAHNGISWTGDIMESAAAYAAACSPRAMASKGPVRVLVKNRDATHICMACAERSAWSVPEWEACKDEIRAWMRQDSKTCQG